MASVDSDDQVDGSLIQIRTAILSPEAQYHFGRTQNRVVGGKSTKALPRSRRRRVKRAARLNTIQLPPQPLKPATPNNHTSTFTVFRKLPLELQLIIWKIYHYATRKPRIVIFGCITVPKTLYGYNEPLTFRQICQQTRADALKRFGYYDIENPLVEGGRIIFHPGIDLCYFAWPRSRYPQWNIEKFSGFLLESGSLEMIKSVAFERLDEFDVSVIVFDKFKALELLLVVKNRLWRPVDGRDKPKREMGFQFDCYPEGGFDTRRLQDVYRLDEVVNGSEDREEFKGRDDGGDRGGNSEEEERNRELWGDETDDARDEERGGEEWAEKEVIIVGESVEAKKKKYRTAIVPLMRFCHEVAFKI